MDEWVWSNGGMILTGGNWSTGRKTLYSVGGGWMNQYGAMVEWYYPVENWSTVEKSVPMPLCPPPMWHGITRGSNHVIRCKNLATDRLRQAANTQVTPHTHNLSLLYHKQHRKTKPFSIKHNIALTKHLYNDTYYYIHTASYFGESALPSSGIFHNIHRNSVFRNSHPHYKKWLYYYNYFDPSGRPV